MNAVSLVHVTPPKTNPQLSCVIDFQDKAHPSESGKVIAYSALNFSVEVNEDTHLSVGSQITATFPIDGKESIVHGFIKSKVDSQNGWILSIQQTQTPFAVRGVNDFRTSRRWKCNSKYQPTGVCESPIALSSKLFFRALEVSKSGWTLVTSLRNEGIEPGQQLKTSMQLPTIGPFKLNLTVVHVRRREVDGEVQLVIGVKYKTKSKSFFAALAQYLLQFNADATAKALYKEGLKTRAISEAVTFKTVETQQEYEEVLALRLYSYGQAQKINATDPSKVISKHDHWDNIFIAKHHGSVIACVLLITPNENQLLEIEEDLNCRIDDVIPKREEVVEITKLCTHSEYRGGDLIAGLFREMGVFCLEKNRTTVICGTDDKLAPLYLNCGFKETNYNYTIERYGNLQHRCLKGDVITSVLGGKLVNPIIWSYLWRPCVEYFSKRNQNKLTFRQNMHLKIHRFFTPIIRRIKA
ncbi:MAG: GNAT family N-acetyltransferase [Gammaproteobacteria bacterium]|nr:GNAT family N-acetyltransferase [Gammaproteobacteria bacterium]